MPSCFLAPIAPANRVIWTRFDHDAYALNLSIERDSAVLDGHALTKGLFVKNIVQIHEPPSLRVGGKVKPSKWTSRRHVDSLSAFAAHPLCNFHSPSDGTPLLQTAITWTPTANRSPQHTSSIIMKARSWRSSRITIRPAITSHIYNALLVEYMPAWQCLTWKANVTSRSKFRLTA